MAIRSAKLPRGHSSHVALLVTAARIDEYLHGDNYMLHLPDAGYTPSPLGCLGVYSIAESRASKGWTRSDLGGVQLRDWERTLSLARL